MSFSGLLTATLFTLPLLVASAVSIWIFQQSISFLETLGKLKTAPLGIAELKPIAEAFGQNAKKFLVATKLDKLSATAADAAKVSSFTNVVLVAIVIVLLALLLESNDRTYEKDEKKKRD